MDGDCSVDLRPTICVHLFQSNLLIALAGRVNINNQSLSSNKELYIDITQSTTPSSSIHRAIQPRACFNVCRVGQTGRELSLTPHGIRLVTLRGM